ncbi:MAG: exopolysaccharide biosynthesis protein [Rickettsiales bacterium]|nr:exopolysaccharide biosynthesis protein [Rickettsiales bacterium]
MDQKKVIATDAIEGVVNSSSSDRLLITDLMAAMEGVGFGLALMIFAFGILIPLPPPFPSIISIPLVIFSLQMMAGFKSPKLPKRFAKLTIKRSTLATLVRKSSPYIRRVESILRPRFYFMTKPFAERVVGFFVFAFATFILLPMPLSNFIPGFGILIISFGLLEKDGLAVILGIIVGLIGIAISIAAIFLGVEALQYIKDWLF